ncbi:SLAP domain-containing protein [Lactobacillus acetotolerans]|uniref:SLAP domain-containing protein n=1 Tax=Lactobacillus acetotolerans TaxID=1600 RepID=UPI0014518BF4|nr:SLAP domain-containing protein [Lactobacillus acetotolerans]QJD73754.1 hypothetical protein HG715_07485 [Lactobacillus acetotolerans]
MQNSRILSKIMTVSAAVLMAAPIAGTTISQTVNAAPTNTSQVGKSSKLSVNSFLYDKNGKKIGKSNLKAGQNVTPISQKTISGANYVEVKPGQFIRAHNLVPRKVYRLTNNAYVYKANGKRSKQKALKKGSQIVSTSNATIKGKNYIKLGSNQYIKSGNAKASSSTIPTSKKVKSFKAYVVKRGYNTYKGVFQNKKSANSHFHKPFNVKKTLSMNGNKYYWLTTTKKHKNLGYINKNALATPNQTKLINVPYVSQYKPVFTPWGCAGAAMTMLLRSQGKHVDLSYVQSHLPMQPTKGGQKGSVYTGVGFGYVIRPGALAKYARRWDKNVINISSSKLTVNDMKLYVQGGKPVLYYGFSSYQKPGDYHRNHCKVLTGYKNGEFRVNDPLYYSKSDGAGTGGKNMKYDRDAISWVPKSAIQSETNHEAITVK